MHSKKRPLLSRGRSERPFFHRDLLQLQDLPLLGIGDTPHQHSFLRGYQKVVDWVVAEPVLRIIQPGLLAECHAFLGDRVISTECLLSNDGG